MQPMQGGRGRRVLNMLFRVLITQEGPPRRALRYSQLHGLLLGGQEKSPKSRHVRS